MKGSGSAGERLLDAFERAGVLERREVAKVLSQHLGPDRSPKYLRRARLRQLLHEPDLRRGERLTQLACDHRLYLAAQVLRLLDAGDDDAKAPHALALYVVGHSDRSTF